jgi:DNA-binding transcriptional regulator YiaG
MMTPEEFNRHRHGLGLSVSQVAAVLKVQPRTVRRWEDGTRDVPGPVQVLILWLTTGKRPSCRAWSS